MSFDFIKVEVVNHAAWIEYNRPPVNAFNGQMVQEVSDALDQIMQDPQARVIILASTLEKYFSVGAEMQVFKQMNSEDMGHWIAAAHGIVKKLRAADKPLLAAIHGTAVGGGLEMTLHCDVRFASTDARLGQPEININLIPLIATTQSLARIFHQCS